MIILPINTYFALLGMSLIVESMPTYCSFTAKFFLYVASRTTYRLLVTHYRYVTKSMFVKLAVFDMTDPHNENYTFFDTLQCEQDRIRCMPYDIAVQPRAGS